MATKSPMVILPPLLLVTVVGYRILSSSTSAVEVGKMKRLLPSPLLVYAPPPAKMEKHVRPNPIAAIDYTVWYADATEGSTLIRVRHSRLG